MKKGRRLLFVIAACMFTVGCQKQSAENILKEQESEVSGPVEATPSQADLIVGEPIEGSTKQYVYVPDRFQVFSDDLSHRLMYAADLEYYHYATFKNISLSDYGFESISLPESLTETDYVVPEGIQLEDIDIPARDRAEVIDASTCFSQTRNIYSIRTPGMYLFHAWVGDYNGEIHTLTLKDFAELLNIGGSLTSDFQDLEILEDGSTRYTCLYKDSREYTGDQVPYYGKAVIRLKDGKAWCAVFAEKDHQDGPKMAEYVLKQSVKYKEVSDEEE